MAYHNFKDMLYLFSFKTDLRVEWRRENYLVFNYFELNSNRLEKKAHQR